MPHDRKGTELKAGDRIRVLAEITLVQPGCGTCNLTAKIIVPGKPPEDPTDTLCLTASLVEKVE